MPCSASKLSTSPSVSSLHVRLCTMRPSFSTHGPHQMQPEWYKPTAQHQAARRPSGALRQRLQPPPQPVVPPRHLRLRKPRPHLLPPPPSPHRPLTLPRPQVPDSARPQSPRRRLHPHRLSSRSRSPRRSTLWRCTTLLRRQMETWTSRLATGLKLSSARTAQKIGGRAS